MTSLIRPLSQSSKTEIDKTQNKHVTRVTRAKEYFS